MFWTLTIQYPIQVARNEDYKIFCKQGYQSDILCTLEQQ